MKTQNVIAIVGGGVSGSLTAYHLLRNNVQARVVLIEPREAPGRGLAYSTPSYLHLLNVPAGKISALPDDPLHFLHWLHEHYDSSMTEHDFAPRAVFGTYIQSLLRDTESLETIRSTVEDVRVAHGEATLHLADGSPLKANVVVVATGNFDPAPLRGVSEAAVRSGYYHHSAWREETFAGLRADAPVVLIGSGLTAVDVILRLRELGHHGTIRVISRHAVFPRRHAAYEPLAEPAISGPAPTNARVLLRLFRNALQGNDWRAVVDSLRSRTNEFWLALSLVEQKRFRRHLQRRWEVVRHRMAPVIADQIEAELHAGTVVLERGNLQSVTPSKSGAVVEFDAGSGQRRQIVAARVINCTGPDMNYARVASPLMQSLLRHGYAVAGPHGTGLWSDGSGALRSAKGDVSDVLYSVGPSRLGTLFESIAVPELRCQAVEMADLLTESFGEKSMRSIA